MATATVPTLPRPWVTVLSASAAHWSLPMPGNCGGSGLARLAVDSQGNAHATALVFALRVKRWLVNGWATAGISAPSTAALTASAVIGASRMPLR